MSRRAPRLSSAAALAVAVFSLAICSFVLCAQDARLYDGGGVSVGTSGQTEGGASPSGVIGLASSSSSQDRSRRPKASLLSALTGGPSAAGFAVSARHLLAGALLLAALSWLYGAHHVDAALRGAAARQQASDVMSGLMTELQRSPGVIFPGLLLDLLAFSLAVCGVVLWGLEVLRPRRGVGGSQDSGSESSSEALAALRRQLIAQALAAQQQSQAQAQMASSSSSASSSRYSHDEAGGGRSRTSDVMMSPGEMQKGYHGDAP